MEMLELLQGPHKQSIHYITV